MDMGSIWLTALMLGAGIVMGALAVAARFGLASATGIGQGARWSGWLTVGIGALAAVIGGWLGALVFGRLYGLPTALWVSALCATLLPWASVRRGAA
jgi:hypothetical protein